MKQPEDTTVVKDTEDAELDEVLTINDLEDPDSDDLGDAIVEDPENAPQKPEKETPSEPSTPEQKPAEEVQEEVQLGESPEPETPVTPEGDEPELEGRVPKDVPGETPREKALRYEVQRMKRKFRTERGQKMFNDVDVPAVQGDDLSEDERKLLEAYDQEQLSGLQKIFGVFAKQQGLVKKEEFSKQTYKTESQKVLDTWLEKHPMYDEKNDPDGVLWKRFSEEFSQYKPPASPVAYTKIFNRIHNELFGIQTDSKGLKQVEAQQEKIKVASHGAAAGGSKPKSKAPVDDETRKLVQSGAMSGFTPEELAEMGLE